MGFEAIAELAQHHEQQHQELILTDIKHALRGVAAAAPAAIAQPQPVAVGQKPQALKRMDFAGVRSSLSGIPTECLCGSTTAEAEASQVFCSTPTALLRVSVTCGEVPRIHRGRRGVPVRTSGCRTAGQRYSGGAC